MASNPILSPSFSLSLSVARRKGEGEGEGSSWHEGTHDHAAAPRCVTFDIILVTATGGAGVV